MKKKEPQQAKTFYEKVESYWKNNKIIVIVVIIVGATIGIAGFTDAVKKIKNTLLGKDEIQKESNVINHQEINGNGNIQAGRDINIIKKDSVVKSGK